MNTYRFTSESVSAGHPDKVADRISDEILDAVLREDPRARVAVETLVTRNLVVLAGEIAGPTLDWEAIARRAIRDIGYGDPDFDADTAQVVVRIQQQSPEIAQRVVTGGAGDQGLMFGYACRETDSLMPAALHYSHGIVRRLAELRKGGDRRLGPDAKSQVTLAYVDGRPVRAETVVVSQMHAASLSREALEALVRDVVASVLPEAWFDENTTLLVNPSGSFVRGGPAVDTGLTGRKIIVDTYGGAAPHGGGAFSGKDPTKVDRSAAYAARWLAKNVVSAGLAERCLVQLAYAIGRAEPVSVLVDTFGTSRASTNDIQRAIVRAVNLTPDGLRERLGLDRPIYARTAAYGHFGREPDADGGFSWERTDLAKELLKQLG